jgi:hypothetical protein
MTVNRNRTMIAPAYTITFTMAMNWALSRMKCPAIARNARVRYKTLWIGFLATSTMTDAKTARTEKK